MKRRERMTRHNYKVYEGHIRNYICPDPQRHASRGAPSGAPLQGGIGGSRLGQFTARVVGNFRDRLRDAGVSVTTYPQDSRHLEGDAQLCRQSGPARRQPCQGIKVIGRRDEGSKKIVPPEQGSDASASSKRRMTDFRIKLIFASSTGVRAGELHALALAPHQLRSRAR